MGFQETLELLLHADASGGIAEVRKFASETGKSVSEVESSFSKIGSAALKLGGTGMAAGGFLTALGDKERQAGEGLKASISAAGQSYDEFEGKIEGAVKSQEHFGHTADETDNALSTLVGSFGDTNAALDRMQLVADLAAKKHIGLADAAQIVAKAHGGAGRIFKEFNIQVGLNEDGTKNYDGALDQLSQKLTGQASASVAGFTGWLKGAAAAGEDFVAGIGEKWGPAILGVSTGLTALGGVMSGVGKGLDWLKAKREVDIAITEADTVAIKENAAAQGLSKTAMLGIGVGAAAAVAGLYAYGQSLNKTTLNSGDLSAGLHLNSAAAVEWVDKLKQSTAFGQSFSDRLRQIADSGDAGIGVLKDYRQHLVDTGQSTAEVDAVLQQAADSQKNFNDNQAAGSGVTADATKKLEEEKKAYELLTQARQHDLDLVNAEVGGEIGLSNAQIATRNSIDQMTQSLKDGSKSTDDHTKATNDAESAIMNEATAAGQLAAKQAEAAGVTDTATASTQAQIQELYGVMATLDPNSPLRQWLGQYISQLKSVPGSINTDFNVYVNQLTSSIQTSGPGAPKKYALGGMVDAPRGKPQLAIVHGGEYVSTADEVDAARHGRTAGGGSHGSALRAVTINVMDDQQFIDGLVRWCKSNGSLPKVVVGA